MTIRRCLATLSIDHGDSVLAEQRRVGPHADDFWDRYPAVYLDPDTQVPVEVTSSFQIGGTPLLWFSEDKTHPVVNAAVMSDLVVADVTRMAAGGRAEIGRLTELGLGRMPGRDLATFLIRARAIATYVHIGAELCLADETDDARAGYRAHFTGSHTYFTSKKHVQPLDFVVTIDPEGVIAVAVP
ncbi:MAG: hypothetical protein H6709_11975 [Kofleriaceae bacterium]|nr:hypothetical protein [Kofleriaceae bacterium]MCB9572794.1 hypothetical protein [Kofleriaceae bacterium]